MSRVLHIGKYFPPFAGGMEHFLADLLPAQRDHGDQVYALVHQHRARWNPWPPLTAETAPCAGVYRAPAYGRVLYAPVSPQFPFWLSRLIQRLRPELLHLHLPNTSAFWALLSPAARRLPWVIHWHSDVVASEWDARLGPAYRVYRPFEQALLKRARAVIVTSPPYLESSQALRPWHPKCRVVPLGIDARRLPEPAAAARAWAEQQWRGDGLRVLSVGRLTYYKGHEVLLRALGSSPAHAVQALIVGRGEQRTRLQTLIERQRLGSRARLAGYCDDAQLAALFASCDCFCLPSLERTEAFGVVLMEAMRYAKPVVACAIPGSGVNWVVEPGRTGLLVPPADPEALAEALAQLHADPARRAELGQAGAQRFFARFQVQRVAAQIGAVYREVLQGAG